MIKRIIFIGFTITCLEANPLCAAGKIPAPEFGLRFLPVTNIVLSALSNGRYGVIYGHSGAWQAHVDYQFAQLNYSQLRQSFERLGTPAVQSSSQTALQQEITDVRSWAVPIGCTYFIRAEHDWFFDESAIFGKDITRAEIAGAPYRLASNHLGLNSAGGYRWLFRHGGFISAAAGVNYQRLVSTEGDLAGALNASNQEASKIIESQFLTDSFHPILEIFFGYIF
jgi:hypothetical protein